MKSMFPLIGKVNQRLRAYLESQPDIERGCTLETQNLCRRFTLDNVALAAFGVDGKSFESEESDFMRLANSFIAPGTFALSMLQMFPLISNLVALKSVDQVQCQLLHSLLGCFRVIPKRVENSLTQIIADSLEYRRANHVFGNDYLQFIAESGFNYAEVAGHAATFFEGIQTRLI